MYATSTGLAPSIVFHPPTAMMIMSPALTSSSRITIALVALTTALSRFGWTSSTSWRSSSAIACRMIRTRRAQRGTASGRGGIGRHAGLRSRWRKPWGFESLRPHFHVVRSLLLQRSHGDVGPVDAVEVEHDELRVL